MNQSKLKDILDQKIIIDHVPVTCLVGKEFEHEVFDSKGSHFLDFAHFIEDTAADGTIITNAPKGLKTVTKVTHGFRLTAKGAIYMPSHLRDSVSSLLDPYAVPVKGRHYGNSGDPDVMEIGRVINGKYVDTYQQGNSRFNIRDAVMGRADSKDALRAIQDAWDSGQLLDPKFEGLGYLLVESLITDPEQIVRILDKRALTVSVEMSPVGKIINSITGNDWREDWENGIDYGPGEVVDGKMALLVYGKLQQEGYAYTSSPADKHAQTVQVQSLTDAEVKQFTSKLSGTVVMMDSTIKSGFGFVADSIDKPVHRKGENMTLLNEYLKTIKDDAEALSKDKLIELYKELDPNADIAIFDTEKESFKLKGLPLRSELVVKAIKDEADVPKVDAILELIEELKVKDSKDPEDPEECGTIKDSSDPQSVEDPKETMTTETFTTFLTENLTEELVLKAIADAGFITKVDADEIQGKLDLSIGKVQKLTARSEVLKDSLEEYIIENNEKEASVDAMLKLNEETLKTLVSLLQTVSEKESTENDAKSFEALTTLADSLMKDLDMTKLKEKLGLLGKPVQDSTPVENPTKADPAKEEKIESIKDGESNSEVTYSSEEILVAKRWEAKVSRRKLVLATSYLTNLKDKGLIKDSFNPEAVLASLKVKE